MKRWNLLVVGIVCVLVAGAVINGLYQMQAIYKSLNAEAAPQGTLIDWGFVVLFSGLAILMFWFWWLMRNETGRAKYANSARRFMYVAIAVIFLIGLGFISFSALLPIYNLLGSF